MTGINPTIFCYQTYQQGKGLCLAFDIVMNGHGGMPEVESKKCEDTLFIVRI